MMHGQQNIKYATFSRSISAMRLAGGRLPAANRSFDFRKQSARNWFSRCEKVLYVQGLFIN
jgi:hypothetical protein